MYHRFAQAFRMSFALLFAIVPLALLAGCTTEESPGGPEGPVDCAAKIAEGRTLMENELWRLSQLSGPPEQPSDMNFLPAAEAYGQAVTSCPDSAEAQFGAGLTSFMAVTQDADLNAAFERWQAFADTAHIFEHEIPGTGRRAAPTLTGMPRTLGEGTPRPLSVVRGLASLVAMAFANPPQIQELQDMLEDKMLPRMDTALERFAAVATHPNFFFTVTPKMQGDLSADARELDLTEIYALLAAGKVAQALMQMAVVYDLNITTYDAAGMAEALAQDSGFLGLRTGGAARMAASRQELLASLDYVEDGLDYLEAETDPQDDDIIKLDGSLDPGDVAEIRAAIASVRVGLSGPIEETADWDGDGDEEPLTFDLTAFLDTPPANLKGLLPPYTVEVRADTSGHWIWDAELEDWVFVPEHIHDCPVIHWDAETFEQWIFPDPTMSGLFPDLTTDAALKATFGITAEGWTRDLSFCQAGTEPPPPPEEYFVTVQGYTYDSWSYEPLAGVTVGTSLDDATTTSDDYGYFFLITTTPAGPYDSLPFTVTGTADGYMDWSTYQLWGNHSWGNTMYLVLLTR